MKKFRLFIFAFVILSLTHLTLKGQRIYLSDSIPRPDFKAYVTTDVTKADLKVFLTDSVKKIYKNGIWYMTNQLEQIDLIVKMVNNPLIANIKIYYVSDPKEAGWINPNKRFYYHHENQQ